MFERRINPETLTWTRVGSPYWLTTLRNLIEDHARETDSRYAAMLLHDWDTEYGKFWQVVPREYVQYLPVPLTELEARRA
jgi:glutamate synthase (NADPH/NADH) large chain